MTTAATSPQQHPGAATDGAEDPSIAAGPDARTAPFSTVLREATREEHTAAETRGSSPGSWAASSRRGTTGA